MEPIHTFLAVRGSEEFRKAWFPLLLYSLASISHFCPVPCHRSFLIVDDTQYKVPGKCMTSFVLLTFCDELTEIPEQKQTGLSYQILSTRHPSL